MNDINNNSITIIQNKKNNQMINEGYIKNFI